MPSEDTPVTKKDLDAALTTALDTAIGALRAEMREEFKAQREYIDERTHDAETRLLRGFADYTQVQQVRFQKLSADVGNINTSTDQRLTIAEERITKLEMRFIEKGL